MLIFSRILVFSLTFVMLQSESTCEEEHESAIQPAPAYVSGKKAILLTSPVRIATLGVVTSIDFVYDTSIVAHAALLIFSGPPEVSSSGLGDVSVTCLGGVTDMAPGHSWNDTSVSWDNSLALTNMYVCTGSNKVEPLSTTNKYALPGAGTYYWLILGYDESYVLTHSSALYKVTYF